MIDFQIVTDKSFVECNFFNRFDFFKRQSVSAALESIKYHYPDSTNTIVETKFYDKLGYLRNVCHAKSGTDATDCDWRIRYKNNYNCVLVKFYQCDTTLFDYVAFYNTSKLLDSFSNRKGTKVSVKFYYDSLGRHIRSKVYDKKNDKIVQRVFEEYLYKPISSKWLPSEIETIFSIWESNSSDSNLMIWNQSISQVVKMIRQYSVTKRNWAGTEKIYLINNDKSLVVEDDSVFIYFNWDHNWENYETQMYFKHEKKYVSLKFEKSKNFRDSKVYYTSEQKIFKDNNLYCMYINDFNFKIVCWRFSKNQITDAPPEYYFSSELH